MHFNNHSNIKCDYMRTNDHVRNVPASVAPIHTHDKTIKTKLFTFLIKAIILIILLKNIHYLYYIENNNEVPLHNSKTCHDQIITIFNKRNSHQIHQTIVRHLLELPDDEEQSWSQTLVLFNVDELNNIDHIFTQEELEEKTTKLLHNFFDYTTTTYADFIADYNKEWCYEMWNDVWCKQAEIYNTEIHNILNNICIPMYFKVQYILKTFNILLYKFNNYLQYVKYEWDLKDEPEHYLER
ncbi:exported protein (hyp11), unknown function [Hepatocystis sp. ex Piliocolobus tephrosceles]|nr:exported protein (hyp11), unknown function [Hepatocystis sp. ex Piliocolobus tephrosceles]